MKIRDAFEKCKEITIFYVWEQYCEKCKTWYYLLDEEMSFEGDINYFKEFELNGWMDIEDDLLTFENLGDYPKYHIFGSDLIDEISGSKSNGVDLTSSYYLVKRRELPERCPTCQRATAREKSQDD